MEVNLLYLMQQEDNIPYCLTLSKWMLSMITD